ncbi:MAG: hypothetical protein H7Y05_14320 [Steroidobacteraceae bacterium]|nr:hypothetical protein [Deltaproteobacteria bacterium]
MPVKRIAFCNYYKELNKNDFMFQCSNSGIGDDLLTPLLELKKYANARGIEVASVSLMDVSTADAVVFIDMPEKDNPYLTMARKTGKSLYLLALESKLIRKENYLSESHALFKKIFTYDDSLIDNTKFFKINYSFLFPASIPTDLSIKEKLCTMIAGNKTVQHPQELYSKRIEAIRWFEQNQPEDFDLYGVGWDEGTLGCFFPRVITRHWEWLKRLGNPAFPSWRGRVVRKRDVMGRYRFALCFENIMDVPGYITEKMFDAFFSGTIPVYRGAENVTDHIPSGCFIDMKDYSSYEELYRYMKGMPEKGYAGYLDAIESFLKSEHSYPFSCEYFAMTIVNGIVGE